MTADTRDLTRLLHQWLDASTLCPYSPTGLCPNHPRAQWLAQEVLASPSIDAVVSERVRALVSDEDP